MRVDASITPPMASAESGSVSSLDSTISPLDASRVEIKSFRASDLGDSKLVAASLGRLDGLVDSSFNAIELGQFDSDTVSGFGRYVDHGDNEFVGINLGAAFGKRLEEAPDTASREGRLKAVLDAGLELLEAAKGPALDMTHIAGRTGLVIVLASLLREYIASLVVHATREGDTPEAALAWATVAAAMTGPVLILLGAIRRECAGEASWKSRLGAALMAIAVVGGAMMAFFTGAASKIFPAMAGGVVYIMARAVGDAFFPLNDKTGPANAVATGVTAALYSVVQGLLGELIEIMPLSGAARATEGLGYDFGADAIKAGFNGLGMVVDVAVLTMCKSWLSPQPGLDSPSFDPGSLQMIMEARATVQWPTRTQVANAFVNVAGTRISYGHALALIGGAATAWLSESDFGDETQGHLLKGCLAVMTMLLYFPLIFANLKRTDNTFNLPQPTITP